MRAVADPRQTQRRYVHGRPRLFTARHVAEYAGAIPVTVLTGFLGSGRTTTLSACCCSRATGRCAIWSAKRRPW
ncbi:MAG: hypothetical protein FJ144_25830 [Deltaproteobacteria bacterium]|nr:hypothetical protein [Deltaproteobacteria bacterium]